MPKGLFTQTVCTLLDRVAAVEEVADALSSFHVQAVRPAAGEWVYGGPHVMLPFRPQANGFAMVDVVDRPWPDDMGSPQENPTLFAGWAMGQLGPFTYPGSLERAGQQCWGWPAGKTIADKHRAFLRIRLSYGFGAGDDDPIMPGDCDPIAELDFVVEVARTLLGLGGSLCYFNPNGEVLRDRDGIAKAVEYGRKANLPPMELWSNVRLFNLEDGHYLMDTVGNWQFDVPDIEACFSDGYDCSQVDGLLRNVAEYVRENGDMIKDGDTMDGPGGVRWQARNNENGLLSPPRGVLSWTPIDGTEAPGMFLER